MNQLSLETSYCKSQRPKNPWMNKTLKKSSTQKQKSICEIYKTENDRV